jgi:hypothetical protein
MRELHIPNQIHAELRACLRWRGVEEVAFLFTGTKGDAEHLHAEEIFCVPPDGFDHQSDVHVSLTDETRAHVIARAWQLGGPLVEAHSHRDGPPMFSISDLLGFQDWVPHVRWRLRGRTYVALVFAPGGFDALVWEAPGDAPSSLGTLTGATGQPRTPSGLTLRELAAGRYR